MPDATLQSRWLTTLARLDEFGLEVVGEWLEPEPSATHRGGGTGPGLLSPLVECPLLPQR